MIEFDDFLFESCNLQNLTITDKGTGKVIAAGFVAQKVRILDSEIKNFKIT